MNRQLLILFAICLTGCQSASLSNPFVKADRTSFRTPKIRADEARSIASQADGTSSPQQQELLNELSRRVQTEPDPLVREVLISSVARFPMPLADQVLVAGLSDSDSGVRQRCCQSLGSRGLATNAAALARAAAQDKEFDVRVAATRALGQIKSPEAVKAIAVSLQDSDPAMQFAGVEAMRAATGKDYGGDVNAYLAHARGEAPVVATRPEPVQPAASGEQGFFKRLSPF